MENGIMQNIQAELTKIAVQHEVKTLFAAESGSRAWGFPARELPVQPLDTYFRLLLAQYGQDQ